jgi:predicted transcriptional regulator
MNSQKIETLEERGYFTRARSTLPFPSPISAAIHKSRRSKFELYTEIISQIKSGVVLPTKIMYASNMSWKPLTEILHSLCAQGIIEELSTDRDRRTKSYYRVTENGENVLRYFNKARDLLEVNAIFAH